MHDLSDRHSGTAHVAQFFSFGHLRAGTLRDTSRECHDLAERMIHELPDGPELTAGLRKLLEAKDCFVRAALDVDRPIVPLGHEGSDRWTGGDRKDEP
jgi:hypothetical protein